MPLEAAIQLSNFYYQDTVEMFMKIVQTILVNKNKSIKFILPPYKHKKDTSYLV